MTNVVIVVLVHEENNYLWMLHLKAPKRNGENLFVQSIFDTERNTVALDHNAAFYIISTLDSNTIE